MRRGAFPARQLGLWSFLAIAACSREMPSHHGSARSALVSPEISFTSAERDVAGGDQTNPRFASTGSTSLVVWNDLRSGRAAVYGARVRDGKVLDPYGIPIAAGADEARNPAVASDGARFFVAWVQSAATGAELAGAWVELDGTVGVPRVLATPVGADTRPELLFDGARLRLVWHCPAGQTLNQVSLSAEGAPVEPSPLLIASGQLRLPALAQGSGRVLVVWQARAGTEWDLYGALLDETGLLGPEGGFPVCAEGGNQSQPAAAFDGTRFLVSFSDDRHGLGQEAIYATWLLPDGTVSAPAWRANDDGDWDAQSALVPLPGGGWLVGFSSGYAAQADTFVRRLAADGSWVEPAPLRVFGEIGTQDGLRLLADGEGFAAVYQDNGGPQSQRDVRFARLSATLERLDEPSVLVSTAAIAQQAADVATNGRVQLVVWEELRADPPRTVVRGGRIGPGGAALDAQPLTLFSAAEGRAPKVASNGTGFLVVWRAVRSNTQLEARSMTADGTLLGEEPVVVGGGAHDTLVELASDGSGYLVVWAPGGATDDDVWARRFAADGTPLDAQPLAVCANAGVQTEPAVAYHRGAYHVVWTDHRSGVGALWTRTLDPATGAAGPERAVVASAAAQRSPSVVSAGERVLVAWQEGSAGPIVASALEGGSQVTLAETGSVPLLGFDGAGVWLAWKGAEVALPLFVRRFDPSGLAASEATAQVAEEVSGSAFLCAPAHCVVAYQAFDARPTSRNLQVRARHVGRELPEGATCEVPADCLRGTCVAGICGEPGDAGFPDAGLPDAGDPDAGMEPPDAGDGADAETPLPGELDFVSIPPRRAVCGRELTYRPTLSEAGPETVFGLEGPRALLEQIQLEPATGELRWTPAREQAGTVELVLKATSEGRDASQSLVIEVRCGFELEAGCGCQGASEAVCLFAWLLLSAMGIRRRPKRGA